MKIGLGVGHTLTGADYGAVGFLDESKCNREVGELVKNYLIAQGHEVIYCRIDNAATVNASLAYRVNLANSQKVDMYFEVHFNAGGGTGTETWIYGTGGRAQGYAKTIVDSIASKGYPNRGVKVNANLYVLRNTTMPAVLIECCFVDNEADKNRYNADVLAKAITKGITGQEVVVTSPVPNIRYEAHVQNIGWMPWVTDGAVAGTEGKSLRLEALAIDYQGSENFTFEGHIENKGWTPMRTDGEVAGTVGQDLRLEAIKINLESTKYKVQYQVHVENVGWMPWVENGAVSGTIGESKRIEAIRIRIVSR